MATWPDFVFEDGYDLKPLTHVEQFIQANKHLEGLPSAELVKKDGVDLGNSQAILLEKVEELTLYMIEADKIQTRQLQEISSLKEINIQNVQRLKTIEQEFKLLKLSFFVKKATQLILKP